MRGKEILDALRTALVGITPAYAGKSHFLVVNEILTKDHPRVCGEKMAMRKSVRLNLGSPPRMRGKADALCKIVVQLRITPAYAGKSVIRGGLVALNEDHPRVCGEKSFKSSVLPSLEGSPPRMRGKEGRWRAW